MLNIIIDVKELQELIVLLLCFKHVISMVGIITAAGIIIGLT